MRSREEAKVSMYKAVDSHFEAFPDIVNQHPALKDLYTGYKQHLKELLADVQDTTQNKTGVAKDKRTRKEMLAQAAFDVANIVKVFAVQKSNAMLQAEVDYSLSELKRVKDELMAGVCATILQRTQENSTVLKDHYLLTDDMLVTLEALLNTYKDSTTAPRQAVAQKSVSNKNVTAKERVLDKLLKNEMDPMMLTLQSREPKFVAPYRSLRKIVDAPKGKGGDDDKLK